MSTTQSTASSENNSRRKASSAQTSSSASQSTSQSTSPSKTKSASEGPQSENLASIISQNIADEGRERIEAFFEQAKDVFEKGRTYIDENPREAIFLGVAAGFAAWAMLATKPGRVAFKAASTVAVPYATKWVSKNLRA